MAGFDKKGFMSSTYEPRTAHVPAKELSDFFGEDKSEWCVRGQTANEIAKVAEAANRDKTLDSVVNAIADNASKVEQLKEILGLTQDTPTDIKRRLEQLVCCSVNIDVDLPLAIKISEVYPVLFYALTNKITELTALGMDIKKPKTSGETAK